MFLVLVDNKVEVTDEGLTLSCIKELDASDRHTGKPWYNASITYIYWMYKKDGMLKNMLPTQRANRICMEYLKDKYSAEKFETSSTVKAVIKEYVDQQYTPTEQLFEHLKKDIEGLLVRIKDIPYVRKKMMEFDVELPNQEGIMVKQRRSGLVEMDNSEEKAKAIKLAEVLIDYEAKLKAKIIKETKETRKEQGQKRMFE